MKETMLEPDAVNPYLEANNSAPLTARQKIGQLILRPNIDISAMMQELPIVAETLAGYDKEAIEQAEILAKYETYINKEQQLVERMSQLENLEIPDKFDYDRLSSLSAESKQKFNKIRPKTLGQASRISGVNPSDVHILMVFMGR